MKREMQLKGLLSFFLVAFLAFTGCKKDDEKPQTGTVTDIDGNVYKTIKIGTQIWMAENLKTTKYRNGESIENVTDGNQWTNMTSGAMCAYDNNTGNVQVYGYLYNWYAVTDSRGLAPEGWHIPSYDEWTSLINHLGGSNTAGGKMKESGTSHWASPNGGADNESGFTALPAGLRVLGASFFEMGTSAFWWATTEINQNDADMVWVNCFNSIAEQGMNSKGVGYSVRCIKD